jgi:phosphoglycerol transferase MdoB-like AlkP superfamily enzyme
LTLKPAERALLKPYFTSAIVLLALWALLRIFLWAVFGRATDVGFASLLWIVPAGALADAVVILYVLAPLALYLGAAPPRWHSSRAGRIVLWSGFGLTLFGLLYVCVAEYYFFEEFDARLNLVAFDYLLYPTEVFGDIWDAYPVNTVLVSSALICIATTFWLRKSLAVPVGTEIPAKRRWLFLGGYAVLTALVAIVISSRTFTWSDNRVARELAVNGISTFWEAARTSEIDYHAYYATAPADKNFKLVAQQLAKGGGKFTRLAEGRLDREFPANPNGLGKLNVVIVTSESFGAEFSKLYGSERDLTPEFDRYAQKGIWFRNMYASGTRTVRGLEAVSSSFPPTPAESIVRRPGNENVATWGKVMRDNGYLTSFLYGGYGYFDNMNYFYGNNGYEVRDRNQIPKPVRFENIWGVADEDLFDMALRYYDDLAKTGKPFFSHIMNTSNHKPFTFRAGVPGVKPTGGGRPSGVLYADFAQGYFLREAEKHPWFDNTVFIIVADHGARVYGKQDIPLKTYEIPMLIYSPKHIQPREVDTLMTQVDVAPTIMGLLGLPYTAPFFGEDVLNTPPEHRIAFLNHNYDVALYRDGELAILGLQKTITDVTYDRATDTYKPAPPNPELNALAIAFYQTASELFHEHKYE